MNKTSQAGNSSGNFSQPSGSSTLETGAIIYIVCEAVIGVFSVLTNSYIISDIYKKRKFINPTNIFNVFLAFGEILYGLVCCPLLILLTVTQDFDFITCFCINNTINVFSNIFAIMLLCTIGERFINMRYHFSYNSLIFPDCIASTLLGVTASCFVIGMLAYVCRVSNETYKQCNMGGAGEVIRSDYLFGVNILFVCIVPVLIISFIVWHIKKNKHTLSTEEEDKDDAYKRRKIISIIEGRRCNPSHPCFLILIFLLLILPTQVLDTLNFLGQLDDLSPGTAGVVMKINNILQHLNALATPFIYDPTTVDQKPINSRKSSEVCGSPKESEASPTSVSSVAQIEEKSPGTSPPLSPISQKTTPATSRK